MKKEKDKTMMLDPDTVAGSDILTADYGDISSDILIQSANISDATYSSRPTIN